jgi:hypothetical protein
MHQRPDAEAREMTDAFIAKYKRKATAAEKPKSRTKA